MATQHPVTILLSTFNGEKFLPSLLSSLLSQDTSRWLLLWRDDGSCDRTLAIMKEFTRKHGARVMQCSGPTVQLGVAASFRHLLAQSPQANAVAFCDQDDVWLPSKLSRAIAALSNFDAGPSLYCGRQILTDSALNPLGLSPAVSRPPSFRNALVQNIATGCTIVMNAPARALTLSAPMPTESVHDWWSYLTVTAASGMVVYDRTPNILYRQHGANVMGACSQPVSRVAGIVQRGSGGFLRRLSAHAAALRSLGSLSNEATQLLQLLMALQDARPWVRLSALRQARLYRQTWMGDLGLMTLCALKALSKSEPEPGGGYLGVQHPRDVVWMGG